VSRVTLASGLTLSYTQQGEASDPALLLVPGPTDSWRSYQSVLDLLPQEIRAVSVSQRGHGDSDKPDRGYAVADFASDVVLLLDALAIERAVLAGHSGSCLVARRVALDHPNRVAGLILEASPTSLRDHPLLIGFVQSVVSDLDDPITAEFARSFVADTSSGNVSPGLVDLLVEELVKVPARVWKQTLAGLLQYDDTVELALIAAPTLLIWGDTDVVVSRDMQDCLAGSIHDVELIVYDGVGHTPRWEDPARFSSDLATFVRRVARTQV
jgi:pimeloyl-ACP methyl ester carboxylesterase